MISLNELNFFENNNKKIYLKQNFIKFVIFGFILATLVTYIYINVKITNLQIELNQLTQDRLNIVPSNLGSNITDELELKRNSVTSIESIENYENVNSDLLEQIKKSLPNNLFLNDMTINDNEIIITGYAKSLNIIANFQSNLSSNSLFNNVFVQNITNDLGNYIFTLTAKMES